MFANYSGKTADEAWLKAAADFRDGTSFAEQNGRGPDTSIVKTFEVLHACIGVDDPRQRWVTSRERPLNLPFALAEVVWIIAGRDDAESVKYFNPGLPRYTGDAPHLHGAYGRRLRSHLGFDQLTQAYHALANCPHSRQVVLQIWDGRIDFPDEQGNPRSKDVPCNLISMLKLRDGKLDWTQIMRSNDLYKGLTYNLVQFTFLQEVLAGWLGLEVGSYQHLSDSLHIYDGKEVGFVKESKPVALESNSDNIALPFAASCAAWAELATALDQIVDASTTLDALVKQANECRLPVGFANILRVLVADGLRRRDHINEADVVMKLCSNKAYKQLWHRWCSRNKKPTT